MPNRTYSLALVLALSGCMAPAPDRSLDPGYNEHGITRWHDKELGVTCYLYWADAIHCIPDHQLMPLEEESQGYYDEEQDVIQDKAVTRT